MNDLQMSAPEKREYDIHPEGPCMAVCRDIWTETVDNPKAGQTNQWGNVEKDKITYIHFEFLTEEAIEIAGQLKPRFIKRRFNLGWSEKSGCRAFVRMWDPKTGKDDHADLNVLVGRGAYLNITHNVNGDKTFANIETIAAPPKGSTIPMIPQDYVRKNGEKANDLPW
jgi:hypothetical protein